MIFIITALKNLEIQKKYFPQIYNSYIEHKKVCLEDKSKEKNKIKNLNAEIKDKIIIVNDNYIEILKILNIPEHIMKEIHDDIYRYNEIVIVDSVLEDIIKDYKDKVLTLKFSHGYVVYYYKISITNKFSYGILKDAAKIILMKDLNEFENSILIKQDIDIEKINEIEDLKIFLFNVKCLYCEKNYIEKILNENNECEKSNIKINPEFAKEHFDDIEFNYIELDKIINDISKDKLNENILNKAMAVFENNSVLILNRVLLEDEFTSNYFAIGAYIKNYEICFNKINDLIKKRTEIFEQCLSKSIDEIKTIVSNQLEDLKEDIEIVFKI